MGSDPIYSGGAHDVTDEARGGGRSADGGGRRHLANFGSGTGARAGNAGRLSALARRPAELGTLGTRRSEGHRQSDYAGEGAKLGQAGAIGHRRVAGASGAAAASR